MLVVESKLINWYALTPLEPTEDQEESAMQGGLEEAEDWASQRGVDRRSRRWPSQVP